MSRAAALHRLSAAALLGLVALAGAAAGLGGFAVDAPEVAVDASPLTDRVDAHADARANVSAQGLELHAHVGADADAGAPVQVRATVSPDPLGPPPLSTGKTSGGSGTRSVKDVVASPEMQAAMVVPAGVAAWSSLRWALTGAAALYSRIGRDEALQHPLRQRMHTLLKEKPGLSPTELQDRLGVGWGTVVHHLDRLERTGHVRAERAGLAKRYFVVGSLDRGTQGAVALLRKEPLERIAQHVVAAPGRPQGEVAQALGLSRSAASKQFAQLEGAGLVRRQREGRTAMVYPTEDLRDLMAGAPAADATSAPAAKLATA